MTQQELSNEYDMLKDNIELMMATSDLDELHTAHALATERLGRLLTANRDRISKKVSTGCYRSSSYACLNFRHDCDKQYVTNWQSYLDDLIRKD